MQIQAMKHIKFERIRQNFGCGYYAICCGNACPCIHKYDGQRNEETYKRLQEEFDKEEQELFGA